jgi:glycolate oxidase iron-sulfur subunit
MLPDARTANIFAPIAGQSLQAPNLPDYETLISCIRCGRCLPVCPTYQETRLETFSPRGRLTLLRAVEDGNLDFTPALEAYLYHCLDCRACNTVCPSGIHIGELIVQGRVASADRQPRPWLMDFVLRHVLINPKRLEMLSPWLRFAQWCHLDRLAARWLGWLPGVGPALRDLTQLAPRLAPPLRSELAPVTPAQGERHHRVAFFLGCIMNFAMADTSRATVHVLTRLGCEVVTPRGQACCGAPQDDQALQTLSRAFARQNIALFEPYLAEVDAIVTDCAGCGGTLKEYAAWLRDDPAWAERSRKFSAKVRDVTEYLDSIWPDSLELRFPTPACATYHDPCHLANVQGVRQQPRRLLGRVQGLEMRELPETAPVRCCGSAGIYNVTHPPMSKALLERKMEDIASTGAQMAVTANPGCMLQLQWAGKRNGHPMPVRHLVEILDQSLPKD